MPSPGRGAVRITALPAQHRPDGAEAVMGAVTGFLFSAEGAPTVYVSGDNASLDVVRSIAERTGPVDVAILFAGRASVPIYFDGAPLTLTSSDAAEAAKILGARAVVPIHCEGWSHYSEDAASVRDAFAATGLSEVLVTAGAGETATL